MFRNPNRPIRLFIFCALLLVIFSATLGPALPSTAAAVLPNPPAGSAPVPPLPPFFSNLGPPSVPPRPSAAPQGCDVGFSPNGAQYWICMPQRIGNTWDNDLIVFAHGYVGPDQPVQVPEDQLTVNYMGQQVSLVDIMNGAYNSLGLDYHYAFATTSYRLNGLAVQQGKQDLVDLVMFFKQGHPSTHNVYLIGVSEGGLITTLSVEQQPSTVFSGGLAVCGPIGDFNRQTDYFGDFRVVFDYFFPALMPGTPVSIPPQYVNEATWNAYYQGTILPAIQNPASVTKLTQLFNVTHAPPYDSSTYATTVRSLLWYSIFATNDATTKLGGTPYDNHNRVYSGSGDPAVDTAINKWVTTHGYRYTASPTALANIAATLQTTGIPRTPLVTAHTTLDEIVPYDHELIYRGKIIRNDQLAQLDQFTVTGYGHCAIDPPTFEAALNTLVNRVNTSRPPIRSEHVMLPVVTR